MRAAQTDGQTSVKYIYRERPAAGVFFGSTDCAFGIAALCYCEKTR